VQKAVKATCSFCSLSILYSFGKLDAAYKISRGLTRGSETLSNNKHIDVHTGYVKLGKNNVCKICRDSNNSMIPPELLLFV
jgi:hypothetical protein